MPRPGAPPSSYHRTPTSTRRPTTVVTSRWCSPGGPSSARSRSPMRDPVTVRLRVNGVECQGRCEPRKLLVDFLREDLGLTGTHVGCEHGICGACTILFNGEAARSCIMLAVQADGAEILTVEGLMQNGKLHPLQEAFREHHGLQCGFCTPGMLITALDLLQTNPSPTEGEIREGIPAVLATMSLIGAPVRRVEDARFLTGRGRYVADMTLSRMLHVAFLRSPYAHARIASIDTRRARELPGVAACVTGDELASCARPIRAESKMAGYRATEFPALARGKVRFAGEAVAAVLAESRYAAEDALEAIDVRYETLPVIATPEAAMAGDATLVHEAAGSNVLLSRAFVQGDAEAAIARAPVVVGGRFRFHRHAGVTLENRACPADWDAGARELTLWSSTQVPGLLRETLADLLDLPAHRLRVVAPDVGGGFGVKSALYPEEVAVCALARLAGRPAKWVGDRREDLLTSTQAWDETIEAELAVHADGTISALRARVVADVGAYSIHPWTASIEVIQVISFLPGPYRVPHYRGEGWGVATNKAPMGPYRGVGRPVSTFVTEALMDRAARRLGIDPVELRLR